MREISREVVSDVNGSTREYKYGKNDDSDDGCLFLAFLTSIFPIKVDGDLSDQVVN